MRPNHTILDPAQKLAIDNGDQAIDIEGRIVQRSDQQVGNMDHLEAHMRGRVYLIALPSTSEIYLQKKDVDDPSQVGRCPLRENRVKTWSIIVKKREVDRHHITS
jgi:hypothetical protein